MKDAGIYLGSISGVTISRAGLGNLSVFNWWQLILIGFYMLTVTIAFAIAGMAIQDTVKNIKNQWNGKKKELNMST